jgi:hypothetical protein
MIELPQLFTARYMAEDVLSTSEVIPVRASLDPPIIDLPYPVEETAETLLPERGMFGDSPRLSLMYWRKLDSVGPERIGEELAEISDRHDNLPLALLDYEDLVKGHGSPRVVFAAWWETVIGEVVLELTDEGEALHYTQLHKQVQPKKPKKPGEDRRWTDDEVRPWPLSHEDVEEWVRGRYWQFAKTMPQNPHSYTHRHWGDEEMFEKVVLHIREHGEQEVFGGREYTYYLAAGRKLWTMGAPLPATVLINCKFDDPEEQACLAEEQTGKSREELGLRIVPEAKPGSRSEGRLDRRAAQPQLSDIDTKEEA